MKTRKMTRKSNKMTKRQNFRLAKMDKKVQMGKHSGRTARAISRHQMASVISGNLNTMNSNINRNVQANINVNPGSIASADSKPKQDKPVTNTSSDILGWIN